MASIGETAKMLAQLDFKDNLTKGVKTAIGSVDKLEKKFSKIGGIASRGLGTAAKNLTKIGLVAGGVVAGGLLLAAKRAGEFDQQMRTINTIARVTDQELGAVGKSIRDLARETGAELADLTSGYYDVLSAGITDTADAQKVLTAATKLGIGALATSAESVDLITTALNAYGLGAEQATHISDIFAKSVEIGKVKASDIAATLANVAPIAHTAGISLEEIAASYGALTAQGLDASETTTQMSRAIIELIKPSKNLSKLMQETGHNYAQIAREKGLHAALTLLRKDADEAGIDILKLFGRIEGGKYVLQTTGSQADIFEAALADIGNAAGTAEGQFAEAEKGFGYTMGRLKQAGIDAAISLGTGLLPGLTKIADVIGRLVGEHGPDLERFGKRLGRVLGTIGDRLDTTQARKAIDALFKALDRTLSDANIRKAMDAIGGLFDTLRAAMPALQSALSISAQVVGKMAELFRSLPPWVQTAVITGWGLNKLTGGALGGIFSELAKGLIKGVLGINAGVVNINAATVNGGGVAGGKAGGIGAGAAIVGGATIGAVVVGTIAIKDAIEAADATARKYPNLTKAEVIAAQVQANGGLENIGLRAKTEVTNQLKALGTDYESALRSATAKINGQTRESGTVTRTALGAIRTNQSLTTSAIRSGTSANISHLNAVATAVRNKKLSVRVTQNQKQSSVMSLRNATGGTTQGKPGFHYTRSQGQDLSRFLAAGAVGLATQPTRAVFGEAGNEAYAILRNPRQGLLGGGAPTVVNVTVNIDPRRITKKQTSSGVYKTYVAS